MPADSDTDIVLITAVDPMVGIFFTKSRSAG